MRTQLRALGLMAAAAALVGACTGAAGAEPKLTFQTTLAPTVAPTAVVTPEPTPAPTVAPTVAAAPTITLSEWKVAVANAFKAGTVKFDISNQGTIQHELLVFKTNLAPSAFPTDASGDIIEDGAGVNLLSDGDNIDPQGSQQRTVKLTPGTYVFVCNIPGHFKAGMYTVVTVTP